MTNFTSANLPLGPFPGKYCRKIVVYVVNTPDFPAILVEEDRVTTPSSLCTEKSHLRRKKTSEVDQLLAATGASSVQFISPQKIAASRTTRKILQLPVSLFAYLRAPQRPRPIDTARAKTDFC